ncbi:tripartite motif-containing protein 16 [Rhinichthys klamathensis goyatoka]|uniref:tripartite motif-containing protein 16 n=1 Tax=Rhinichthys klamathensis goyatoka TaxID=3034132 RepID=UPI0024B587F5|nr:tripartite motif-containing protein 16 [Rhinichthys klamathensis goyatoka]
MKTSCFHKRLQDTKAAMGSMEEEHTCPMCRDLFGRAQPFPCGHSFCPACAQEAWSQSGKRRFVCPQCLEEQGLVVCDCCPEGEGDEVQAAVKTCLRCEVSLCEQHLQPHLQRPAYSTHLLVEPLMDVTRRRCPTHWEVFRYYCMDDREYICQDCILEGRHAQHQVKGVRKVEEEYKVKLQSLLEKAEEKVKQGEIMLQEHQNACASIIEDSSVSDVSQVLQMGSALQTRVGRLVSAVINITEQERQQAMDRVQEDCSRVREDLNQTESLHRFLGSLLDERDPFLLIWAYQTEDSQMMADLNSPLFTPPQPSMDKKRVLENVENKYREFIADTLRCLIELKRDLLSSPLTLDKNSAHPLLNISEDLHSVMRVKKRLPVPEHQDRFDHWSQVVSCQILSTGTHYWELEVEGFWDIAVTYHSIGRKAKEGTAFGCNKISWSLTQQRDRKLAAWHNRKKTQLSVKMSGNHLAVALDYNSGSITFSEVGSASTLLPLHNFSTSFTQPVCLGFGLYKPELNSRVTVLKKI